MSQIETEVETQVMDPSRNKKFFLAMIESQNKVSSFQAVCIVTALSAIVKIGYILVLGGGLGTFPAYGTDGAFYDHVAQVLLSTGVFGTAAGHPITGTAPGQPVFLAILYALSGHSISFAKLAHVGLLTLAAVLTFLTAEQLTSRTIGLWAGILIAVDPGQAYLAGTFLSEPLFICLIMLGVYFLTRYRARASNVWLLGTGLCFGLAGLTRNEGWLFAIALWIGAVVTRGWILRTRAATVVLLVTVGVILPWTCRNFLVSGAFVPVSSNGGLNLWSGNNPEFQLRQITPMSLPIYQTPPGLSEIEKDTYYRQRAIDWIMAHPEDFAINAAKKIIVLYNFDPLSRESVQGGLYHIAGLIPYGLLIPFILLGLLINVRGPQFGIILWYILFTTLIAAIFFGDSRIRAPIEPYLYIFGVLGVNACVGWIRGHLDQHVKVLDEPGTRAT